MKKKLLILFTFAALVFPSTVFAATKSGGYVIRNDSFTWAISTLNVTYNSSTKKVYGGDVEWRYKYPLGKKFNTYVTKVSTYSCSAYATATVGGEKRSGNWTVKTK